VGSSRLPPSRFTVTAYALTSPVALHTATRANVVGRGWQSPCGRSAQPDAVMRSPKATRSSRRGRFQLLKRLGHGLSPRQMSLLGVTRSANGAASGGVRNCSATDRTPEEPNGTNIATETPSARNAARASPRPIPPSPWFAREGRLAERRARAPAITGECSRSAGPFAFNSPRAQAVNSPTGRVPRQPLSELGKEPVPTGEHQSIHEGVGSPAHAVAIRHAATADDVASAPSARGRPCVTDL
jgi:hypothetical protein